jgi:chromosome segregation ATPase
MSAEERVLRLENAFSTLVGLARTQSERMDEYERRSEELAEAHERRSKEIAEAQKQTESRIEGLAEAQKQTEAHISVLAKVMAHLGRAQTRTEKALASLTERFEQYISSRA